MSLPCLDQPERHDDTGPPTKTAAIDTIESIASILLYFGRKKLSFKTMIRHFFFHLRHDLPPTICLLPIGMMQPSLHALLVVSVVLTTFLLPGFLTAGLAAVTLASLAATTDKENLAAQRAQRTSESERLGDDHVPLCQKGLDKGRRSVRAFSRVGWRSFFGGLCLDQTPIVAIDRGFSCSLESTSLCHIDMVSLLPLRSRETKSPWQEYRVTVNALD